MEPLNIQAFTHQLRHFPIDQLQKERSSYYRCAEACVNPKQKEFFLLKAMACTAVMRRGNNL